MEFDEGHITQYACSFDAGNKRKKNKRSIFVRTDRVIVSRFALPKLNLFTPPLRTFVCITSLLTVLSTAYPIFTAQLYIFTSKSRITTYSDVSAIIYRGKTRFGLIQFVVKTDADIILFT